RRRNGRTTPTSSRLWPRKSAGSSAPTRAATQPLPPPLVSQDWERSGTMTSILRRRGLLNVATAGGDGLVSPPSASSALARDTKKPGADEAVSPPEQLMRGHAILARVLLIYEGGLRRAGQGEDIDPAVFTRAADITKRFIHGHQEKVEEELVFAQ